MRNDLISRPGLRRQLAVWMERLRIAGECGDCEAEILQDVLNLVDAQAVITLEPITGDTSDGYHTFNELYHHRAILFSVICNSMPGIAWKAKKHHDGRCTTACSSSALKRLLDRQHTTTTLTPIGIYSSARRLNLLPNGMVTRQIRRLSA